jgi:hypothetical protein
MMAHAHKKSLQLFCRRPGAIRLRHNWTPWVWHRGGKRRRTVEGQLYHEKRCNRCGKSKVKL